MIFLFHVDFHGCSEIILLGGGVVVSPNALYSRVYRFSVPCKKVPVAVPVPEMILNVSKNDTMPGSPRPNKECSLG